MGVAYVRTPAGRRIVDALGKRYGRLRVVCRAPNSTKGRATRWWCICDCGELTSTRGEALRRGTKSCGCLREDVQRERLTIDEVGKRHGMWLVLSKAEDRGPGAHWLCRCDCGTEREVNAWALRYGASKSCGCTTPYKVRCALRHPEGSAARNKALAVMRTHARTRGYAWNLSSAQAYALFAQDCDYCGAAPSNHIRDKGGTGSFTYSGIDRVNNARGYEPDNVVPCCKHCNIAKRDRTRKDFLEWIARVHSHSKCGEAEN